MGLWYRAHHIDPPYLRQVTPEELPPEVIRELMNRPGYRHNKTPIYTTVAPVGGVSLRIGSFDLMNETYGFVLSTSSAPTCYPESTDRTMLGEKRCDYCGCREITMRGTCEHCGAPYP